MISLSEGSSSFPCWQEGLLISKEARSFRISQLYTALQEKACIRRAHLDALRRQRDMPAVLRRRAHDESTWDDKSTTAVEELASARLDKSLRNIALSCRTALEEERTDAMSKRDSYLYDLRVEAAIRKHALYLGIFSQHIAVALQRLDQGDECFEGVRSAVESGSEGLKVEEVFSFHNTSLNTSRAKASETRRGGRHKFCTLPLKSVEHVVYFGFEEAGRREDKGSHRKRWCIGDETVDSLKRVASLVQPLTHVALPKFHAVASQALAADSENNDFSCLVLCQEGGSIGRWIPEYLVIVRCPRAARDASVGERVVFKGGDGLMSAGWGKGEEAAAGLVARGAGDGIRTGGIVVGKMRPFSAVDARRVAQHGTEETAVHHRRNRPISAAVYTREYGSKGGHAKLGVGIGRAALDKVTVDQAVRIKPDVADQGGTAVTGSEISRLEVLMLREKQRADASVSVLQSEVLDWQVSAALALASFRKKLAEDERQNIEALRYCFEEETKRTQELLLCKSAAVS